MSLLCSKFKIFRKEVKMQIGEHELHLPSAHFSWGVKFSFHMLRIIFRDAFNSNALLLSHYEITSVATYVFSSNSLLQ